jgi:hypothetical protein
MKKAFILGLAIISVNPYAAFAGDDKYPASNFEPSVVYMDEQLAAQSNSAKTEVDAKYPAASFEPTVIYIDENAAQSSATVAAQVEVDPKYPAYNFQPKIIYP